MRVGLPDKSTNTGCGSELLEAGIIQNVNVTLLETNAIEASAGGYIKLELRTPGGSSGESSKPKDNHETFNNQDSDDVVSNLEDRDFLGEDEVGDGEPSEYGLEQQC